VRHEPRNSVWLLLSDNNKLYRLCHFNFFISALARVSASEFYNCLRQDAGSKIKNYSQDASNSLFRICKSESTNISICNSQLEPSSPNYRITKSSNQTSLHINPQLIQLFGIYRSRCVHHQVFAVRCFRESHRIADGFTTGHQHHPSV
jgi:hypothetical protein